MKRDWESYFELTKNKPPRPLLVTALQYVTKKNFAIDLGAGALNDSLYLLSQDFKHVVAVDKKAIAQNIAASLPTERFIYAVSSIEQFNFPKQSIDLINAQFALPFVSPEHFSEVWAKIEHSLTTAGIFTGQLFGDRDEWKNNQDMNFHTEEKAHKLLSDFEVIYFKEDEEKRPTAEGTLKHWHVFHFIARK